MNNSSAEQVFRVGWRSLSRQLFLWLPSSSPMHAHERIEGFQKLVALLGYWPSFHDAEVMWLKVDRKPVREGIYGPSLEMVVHTSEPIYAVGTEGGPALENQSLVRFRFHGVDRLKLEDFSHQNVLDAIVFKGNAAQSTGPTGFEISLIGECGLEGSFLCKAVEVVEVTRCDAKGYPLTDSVNP